MKKSENNLENCLSFSLIDLKNRCSLNQWVEYSHQYDRCRQCPILTTTFGRPPFETSPNFPTTRITHFLDGDTRACIMDFHDGGSSEEIWWFQKSSNAAYCQSSPRPHCWNHCTSFPIMRIRSSNYMYWHYRGTLRCNTLTLLETGSWAHVFTIFKLLAWIRFTGHTHTLLIEHYFRCDCS